MIDTDELAKQLTGVVGLYSTFSAYVDNVPAPIHQQPQVYLSDVHKLLRPEIIDAVGPTFADDYIGARLGPYAKYDLVDAMVDNSSQFFESLVPNNTIDTVSDPTRWQPTTLLSAWYGRIERGAIRKLALDLATNPPVKAVIDRQPVFNNEGNMQNRITPNRRFVGLRVRVKKPEIALQLARLGIQLTGPVTNLPVYIFHSESAQPIATILVSGTTSNRTIWAEVGKYLYQKQGGYYLIGYFEKDLPVGVRAIGSERGFSVSGCSSCSGVDYSYAQNREPIVDIRAVFVENAENSGVMDWAEENPVARQTWGFNLIISARCNVTDLILNERESLVNTLMYYIACDVLEYFETSDRINTVVTNMRPMAHAALYGQASMKTDFGLTQKRNSLLNDLKAVFAGISPTCLKTEAPRKPQRLKFGNINDPIR